MLTGGESTVLCAPLVKPTRHRLVESRHVSQQRGAGRVYVHTDIIHTTLHHRIQRRVEVARFDIVLVETNTDVCRLDFHEFRKRILEPTPNRNRATHRGLMRRQFLAGIHTR